MPVVGMVIKSIDAKNLGGVSGSVKVNNRTNLKEVREQDLPALNKKGLEIAFEFKTEYEVEKKKFAEINIEGNALFVDPAQEKILKEWKKSKKLPENVNIQIINAVLRRCLTKALTLSEDLQLPPPIAIPFAAPKGEEESRYIG